MFRNTVSWCDSAREGRTQDVEDWPKKASDESLPLSLNTPEMLRLFMPAPCKAHTFPTRWENQTRWLADTLPQHQTDTVVVTARAQRYAFERPHHCPFETT